MKKPRCQFNRIPGQCRQYNCCYLMNNGGCSLVSKQMDTNSRILLAQMKIDDLRRIDYEKSKEPVVKQRKNNRKKVTTC